MTNQTKETPMIKLTTLLIVPLLLASCSNERTISITGLDGKTRVTKVSDIKRPSKKKPKKIMSMYEQGMDWYNMTRPDSEHDDCLKLKDGSCDPMQKIRVERCAAWSKRKALKTNRCEPENYIDPESSVYRMIYKSSIWNCLHASYDEGIPSEECIEERATLDCDSEHFLDKKKRVCGGDPAFGDKALDKTKRKY